MTRFSVQAAEPETELASVIPTIDSDTAVAKSTGSEPTTTTAEINEHPVTPVTLRIPKSAIANSSFKDDDISPKEVRFNFAAKRDSIQGECEFNS